MVAVDQEIVEVINHLRARVIELEDRFENLANSYDNHRHLVTESKTTSLPRTERDWR